jgi:hypothetical protein
MGRSYTYKWQIGRTYRIKHTMYDVVYQSSIRKNIVDESKRYNFPKIKKDMGHYALLVPVAPSMTASDFEEQLRKYHNNYKMLRG